jgi:hypothetical protein
LIANFRQQEEQIGFLEDVKVKNKFLLILYKKPMPNFMVVIKILLEAK